MSFFSKYKAFPTDSDKEGKGLDEDFLELFEDEMLGSDRLLCVLTSLGVKPACDVEGFFDSRESFDKFVSLINKAGLNCYVEYDPSETEVESMQGLFEEEDVKVSLNEDYEVKARMFLSKESYDTSFFRKMKFFKKVYRSCYHRMYGRFLGFKERDIEAFVEQQKPWWVPGPRTVNDALRPEKIAEKYGEDFSKEQLKAFEALHFGLLEDSKSRFYEGIEDMEERKQLLEESSFEVDKVIEERSFQ